jgi:hypothetical protein
MMINDKTIKWLLQSDVSVQYQVYRDLLGKEDKSLRNRILTEGWGARLLSLRHPDGYWGLGFYQPKWTSSHYSLLDIKNLNPDPDNQIVKTTIDLIFENEKGPDGGINPSGSIAQSDVCINGMVLNYAAYFHISEDKLKSVIDYMIKQQLPDGGFNCRFNRSGAVHSSLHSTLSVCEGIYEYLKNKYTYRRDELKNIKEEAESFILDHRLYLSDRTGEVIHKDFLRLSYPGRWRYDILRALNYFYFTRHDYDERMRPAIDVLLRKRRKDELWNLQAKHPGKSHFDYEEAGKPSRWNTLRALRVLSYYGFDEKTIK